MLVDLGRNDIGRVSEIGSVTIDKYMKVEKYSHVMHIVSEVYGTLRKRMSGFDALAYCLPARDGIRCSENWGDGNYK